MSDITIDNQEYNIIHMIYLNGEPIAGARCPSMAKRIAAQLNEARDLGPRGAMHLLTEELGMCDDFASHVFELLTDAPPHIN